MVDKSIVGRRVRMIRTGDQWTNLRAGLQGTVSFVDDTGTIFIKWDNGVYLGMIPGEDVIEYLPEEK